MNSRISEMLKRREISHNDTLNRMKQHIKDVNEKIKNEIRKESGDIKRFIENVTEEINFNLNDIKEKMNVSTNQHSTKKIIELIKSINECRSLKIFEYVKVLHNIEAGRIEQFKEIYKETYGQILEIGYWMPFQINNFFTEELQRCNEITLSNIRHYKELEKHLILQIQSDIMLWSDKIKQLDDKWHELQLIASIGSEVVEVVESETKLNRLWVIDVQRELAAIDSQSKQLIQYFNIALINIYNRLNDDLQELAPEIKKILSSEASAPFLLLQFDGFLILDLSQFKSDEIKMIKKKWTLIIQKCKNNLRKGHQFLYKTCFLWNHHYKRRQDAKDLIMEGLRKTQAQNSLNLNEQKILLHIALDELRQEASLTKLEGALEKVNHCIGTLKSSYETGVAAELAVLEKYRYLAEQETKVLITEIEQFLNLFPPDSKMDPKKQWGRGYKFKTPDKLGDTFIPLEIFYCKFQGVAIRNWQFGLWEAIRQQLDACASESKMEAELFISAQKATLEGCSEFIRKIHQDKLEVMKVAFYLTRKLEIVWHSNRLESHEKAIQENFVEIKANISTTKLDVEKIVTDFLQDIESLHKKIENVFNSRQVRECRIESEEIFTKFDEALSKSLVCCRDGTKTKLEMIKVSSYLFLEAVLFFYESGNFHRDESKILMKTLTKLSSQLTKQTENFNKDILIMEDNTTFQKTSKQANLKITFKEFLNCFNFHETAIGSLKNLQYFIRNETFHLGHQFELTKLEIRKFENEFVRNLDKYEYALHFLMRLQKVIDTVVELKYCLNHPTYWSEIYELNHTSTPVDVGEEESCKSVSLGSDNADLDCLVPSVKNVFMENCINMLLKTYSSMETLAKEFYKKNRIPAKLKMQRDFDSFIKEVSWKIENYQNQCDLYWQHQIKQFINITNGFVNFLLENFNTFATNYINNIYAKFERKYQEKVSEINLELEDHRNAYMAIHNKLKPMFGHPKHHHFLDELDLEMVALENKYRGNVGRKIELFVDQLKVVHQNLTQNINNMYDIMQQTAKENILNDLSIDLMDQMDKYLQNNTIKQTHRKFKEIPVIDISESPLKFDATLGLVPDKFQKISKLISYIDSMLKVILENNIEQLLKKSAEEDEIHDHYKSMWQEDKKRILALYQVKYDVQNNLN